MRIVGRGKMELSRREWLNVNNATSCNSRINQSNRQGRVGAQLANMRLGDNQRSTQGQVKGGAGAGVSAAHVERFSCCLKADGVGVQIEVGFVCGLRGAG